MSGVSWVVDQWGAAIHPHTLVRQQRREGGGSNSTPATKQGLAGTGLQVGEGLEERGKDLQTEQRAVKLIFPVCIPCKDEWEKRG